MSSLKQFVRILIFGHSPNKTNQKGTYQNQLIKLQTAWNNDLHKDAGIERLVRLFLILIQYVLPGLHIRAFARTFGSAYRDILIELFVFLKTIIPFILLFSEVNSLALGFFIVWLLIDTLVYLASLFLLDDLFPPARSYRRSIILLFLNYIEITASFAYFYYVFGKIVKSTASAISSPLDHLYFSFISAATIGYGDLTPGNDWSKILVILQTIVFLIMVLMLFNFFISKVENLKI